MRIKRVAGSLALVGLLAGAMVMPAGLAATSGLHGPTDGHLIGTGEFATSI